MKKFLKNANSGIICLIEIVVGVLLLVNASALISYILILAGAFIAASGVISGIKYFVSPVDDGEKAQTLTKALVSISIGAFLLVNNDIVSKAAGIITFVFGAVILYAGYVKLQKAFDKIRRKQFFAVALVSALVTIACAALVLFVIKENIIWIFIGISLIVEAAVDLADMVSFTISEKKKASAKSEDDEKETEEAEEPEEKTEE